MQKIIGCILIIAAGSGMGWLKALELQKHLEEVQRLRELFLMLRSEIRYTKAPLQEAFYHMGKRTEDIYGEWLLELSKRLEEKAGKSFPELWTRTIETYLSHTYLKKTDLEKLKDVGTNMGYMDEEMQIGAVNLYLERLELEIQQMWEELAARKRLCNCLGVMGGIFLAVVLI